MKIRSVAAGVALALFAAAGGAAMAQEHYTEGPVWSVTLMRTNDGQFDNYMEFLRANWLPNMAEGKKQGLILDYKVFVADLNDPNGWNVGLAVLNSSFGKALDYNADDEKKWDAITAKTMKTADKDKQDEMSKPRFSMRTFVRTYVSREVTLKPMP